MIWSDLIRIARHLARGGVAAQAQVDPTPAPAAIAPAAGRVGNRLGRPRQTDLCRAVSASYYAMFHTLARCGADTLVGRTRASRSQRAWEQTYRALEHGHVKNQCSKSDIAQFLPEIQDFGKQFVVMQRQRHHADYAPVTVFMRARVIQYIDETERIIRRFNDAPDGDLQAFAVYALFRLRQD